MGRLQVLLLSSLLCPWKPRGRTLSRSCCLLLSSEQNHSGTFSAGSERSREGTGLRSVSSWNQTAHWDSGLVWTGQTC